MNTMGGLHKGFYITNSSTR